MLPLSKRTKKARDDSRAYPRPNYRMKALFGIARLGNVKPRRRGDVLRELSDVIAILHIHPLVPKNRLGVKAASGLTVQVEDLARRRHVRVDMHVAPELPGERLGGVFLAVRDEHD